MVVLQKRSVIVLEKRLKHPNSKNFLLHGYQLDVRNIPAIRSESALITLFKKIGTPQEVDKEDNIIKNISRRKKSTSVFTNKNFN